MAIPGIKRIICQLTLLLLFFQFSCKNPGAIPSKEAIGELQLKEGTPVSCGPPEKEFGKVAFAISSRGEAAASNQGEAATFNQGVALLHSFEYDEAEKVFAGIIHRDPACAMAYWGVAMSNFHALWAPPTAPELQKGAKALAIAKGIGGITPRERDYIGALSAFYGDWDKVDHLTRCRRFETAMDTLHRRYPDDVDATVFYALSLTAAADPTDKTRSRQRKAGAMLETLYKEKPDHPGIIHYIIHAYDYPELAGLALDVAKRYATVAPSSAHALHMPSHIFTRLGLWDDCIQSNLVSVASAKCYAGGTGIRGHWDEELHGMDYLAYAYLQKGKDGLARAQWDSLLRMETVSPANFKVAYAFAAIPSRYLLETRDWAGAAKLEVRPVSFSWTAFPWQEAIIHFTRAMGDVHTGRLDSAKAELTALGRLHDRLVELKDAYKANQVAIQQKAVSAWIAAKEGKQEQGVDAMAGAAQMEESTEKHSVTPCEVLPARELLGDMFVEMGRYEEAMRAYDLDLTFHPNRFNGLYGAGMAARKAGDRKLARKYFKQLAAMVGPEGAAARNLEIVK